MKKRPVIGITGNERPFPDDPDANMSYAATGFVEAVKEAGGIPLILPIGDADLAKHYVAMIDKLIITGGQNVLPKFYGEEITIDSDDYLLKRDLFELALIEELSYPSFTGGKAHSKESHISCRAWDPTLQCRSWWNLVPGD